MNKYHRKSLSKTITAIVIASTVVNTFPYKSFATQNNITLTENFSQENEKDFLYFNGDFEEVHSISGTAFASFWKDAEKPKNWDLRHHTSAPNHPFGEIIGNDVTSGTKAVKIDLNKSAGFLLQSINVKGGTSYSGAVDLKTSDLSINSTNTSHFPFQFRIEEINKENKTIVRHNVAQLRGSNDWKTYNFKFDLKPETVSLKFVFTFDTFTKTGANGTVFIDNLKLKQQEVEPTGISLDKNEIVLTKGYTASLNPTISPKDTTYTDVVWSSSDENIATIKNGEVHGVNEGNAIITATLKDYPNIKAECKVKVKNFVPIEKIEFDKNDFNINLGKHLIINPNIYPSTSKEKFSYEISNPKIATLNDGILKGIAPGETMVLAKNSNGKTVGQFKLIVDDYTKDKYDKLIDRQFNSLIPNNVLDVNNPSDMEAVSNIANLASGYWSSMNKGGNRLALWDEYSSTTESTQITKSFDRLWTMTRAYFLKGSSLEGNNEMLNDIISGLDWILENRYDGKSYYKNWWDWQIGSPQKLNDILIMLNDYLSKEQMERAFKSIDFYTPNSRDQWKGNTNIPAQIVRQTVGANRTDMCLVVGIRGILGKDDSKLKEIAPDMMQELEYVTKLDGFYKDGSIIQHTALPYTGTYGSILLSGIGKVTNLLAGSEYGMPQDKVNMMYDVIEKSFEPLMHKGLLMDAVSGRSISRATGQDINNGEGLMKTVVKYYIPSATDEKSKELKEMVKYWLVSNDAKNILQTTNDLEFRALANEIVNDSNVKLRGELHGNYNFANMDRVVHRSKGFSAALSMYSTRTFMHEGGMNGENLKGYHTADGMLYLYNDDLEQFNKNFWPTVDPYRLPGTTVDTKKLPNSAGGDKQRGNSDWVGGSSLGNYGASGMQLDKNNHKGHGDMNLTAKKSYFFLDNEIVALGSDINSSTDSKIETVVDNRRLINGNEKVTVNGNEVLKETDKEESHKNVNYIHLEGSKANTSIGYYFPETSDINLIRDYRTGSWKDINNGQSADEVSNTYMTITLDHGVAPKNSKYSYVILPNASADETKSYAEKSNVKILSNNKDVQAVKDEDLGVIAANFWNENGGKADYISVNSKASITLEEKDGEFKIGISDPTMNNDGIITVELDRSDLEISNLDPSINLIEKSIDKIILAVNVKDTKGETKIAEFKVKNTSTPDSNPDTDTKPESKPNVDTNNKPNVDNNSSSTPDLEPNKETNTKPNVNTDNNSSSSPSLKPNVETDIKPESKPNIETNTKPNNTNNSSNSTNQVTENNNETNSIPSTGKSSLPIALGAIIATLGSYLTFKKKIY